MSFAGRRRRVPTHQPCAFCEPPGTRPPRTNTLVRRRTRPSLFWDAGPEGQIPSIINLSQFVDDGNPVVDNVNH